MFVWNIVFYYIGCLNNDVAIGWWYEGEILACGGENGGFFLGMICLRSMFVQAKVWRYWNALSCSIFA